MNNSIRSNLGLRLFSLKDVWKFPIIILVRRNNINVGGPENINMKWCDVGYINCSSNTGLDSPVLPNSLISPLKRALYKNDEERVVKLLLCISDYIAGWNLYKESIK